MTTAGLSGWRPPDPPHPLAARWSLVAGPVAGATCVATGILAGRTRPPSGAAPLAVLVVVAGLGATVAGGSGRRILLGVALVALGGAVEVRAVHGTVASPVAAAVSARSAVALAGEVVGDPDVGPVATVVVVRAAAWAPSPGGPTARGAPPLDGGAWTAAGGRHVLVRSVDRSGRLGVLAAGDHVVVVGRLGPLSGYDLRWADRHVVGRLDAHAIVGLAPPRGPVAVVAEAVRGAVLSGGVVLPVTERALVAGVLVGDDRALPDAVADDFRAAGLTHLLAVSGANLAFVLALVRPALARRGRWTRAVGALAVVGVFGTMTRWEPSVLRAAAMTGLAIVADALGRPQDGLRVLALAVAALLVVDPFLLRSIGFGLSVGASAGILLLARPLAGRLPGPRPLAEAAAVSASAQIGVLPVALPVFGSVPLAALPANLAAGPAAGALTVCGLVSSPTAGLLEGWSPGAAALVQTPARLLARWLVLVADVAARCPVAVDARALWAGVAMGAAVAAAVRARRRGVAGGRIRAPGGVGP